MGSAQPFPRAQLKLQTLRQVILEKFQVDPSISMIDVDELIAFACQISRPQILAHPELPIQRRRWNQAMALAEKRLSGTPVPLLTGTTDFCGISLAVRRGVLLPRPETEQLVETVLDWTSKRYGDRPLTILELGVGSGAIGLSLAHHRPTATVVGWDISRRAITLAKRNQTGLNLPNCHFLEGDFFKEAPRWISHSNPPSPVIFVSNPPYIPTSVLQTLDPSVQENDPRRALDGGPTGLRFHRKLIDLAAKYFSPLFLEIGYDQSSQIYQLGAKKGLETNVINDYSGNPRIGILASIDPAK
jgi:release factor glutamine methyltransferase